jgi:hypothetical protein
MATHSPPPPTADGLDLPDWPTDPAKDAPRGNSLSDLEERVARLNQDVAFFTVVDPDRRKIFEVGRDFVAVYAHDSGVPVSMMTALDHGGLLGARSGDGSRVMKAGANGSSEGVFIEWDGVPRIELGRRSSGNFALRVKAIGGGEKNLAAIGESLAGTGALVVGTRTGEPRVSMTVDQGRGAVTIFDEGGAAVASLRQAEAGPGFLSLGKAGEFVKMVVNGGYGAVLAGPVLGFPHVPASGIPGSYLLGCSGGPACHP